MERRRVLSGIAFVTMFLGVGAAYADGRPIDPVRCLERAGARLARTRYADRELTALQGPRLVLSVRQGVIVASKSLEQRGFFLEGPGRTLSQDDRAELGRLIATRAPGTSGRELLRGLGRSIRAERALERRLDPVIDGMLRGMPPSTEREVWRGARGSLVLSGGLLVGYHGFSQTAFPVTRAGATLAVTPDVRARLRDFLRRAE